MSWRSHANGPMLENKGIRDVGWSGGKADKQCCPGAADGGLKRDYSRRQDLL